MNKNERNDAGDFPGYPSHHPSEDITNQSEQVEIGQSANPTADDDEPTITDPVSKTDEDAAADVTADDIKALSAAEQNRDVDDADLEEAKLDMTDEEGDLLNEISSTYSEAGAGLDVPGSEADDSNEAIGEEDEENNYYSLGGDNNENLEEDNTSS